MQKEAVAQLHLEDSVLSYMSYIALGKPAHLELSLNSFEKAKNSIGIQQTSLFLPHINNPEHFYCHSSALIPAEQQPQLAFYKASWKKNILISALGQLLASGASGSTVLWKLPRAHILMLPLLLLSKGNTQWNLRSCIWNAFSITRNAQIQPAWKENRAKSPSTTNRSNSTSYTRLVRIQILGLRDTHVHMYTYTENAPEWQSQGEIIAQVSGGNLSASKTNNNKGRRYVRNVHEKKTRRKSFSQTQIH